MRIRSLRMVEHFLAASRHGNLHRAAEDLSLTQTAITKSIRQLEEVLGVRLFERSVRGMTLTSYGHALHARAMQIETQCDFLERELDELASGRFGTLTIGAGTVWSTVLLPEILTQIQAGRPSVRFIVLRSVGHRFREQFAKGEIDMGLGYAAKMIEAENDLVFEPLSTFDTVFLAREGHPLNGKIGLGLDDLTTYRWAMFQLDDALFERVKAYFLAQGLPLGPPSFLADSVTSVMRAVAVSDMITCLPVPLLSIASKYGVAPLKLAASPLSFESGVMYRKSAAGYPLLEHTLQCLRQASGAGAA